MVFNNGLTICFLSFQTSNKNGSTWNIVNLPISFTKYKISVGTVGWWGATLSTIKNGLSQIEYMIWDYKNNTNSTQVAIISIGY